MWHRGCLAVLAVLAACGGEPAAITDAATDGARIDATELDATAIDATAIDATELDATAIDATEIDATAIDATEIDAAIDAGVDAAVDASPDASTGFPDPAPGVDVPGEHTGPGCPDSNQTTFTLNVGAASAYTFSGVITGGQIGDGTFWVRGPGGETIGGPIQTAANGSYAKTLPLFCGENLVKLVWTNGTCPLVLVYVVNRTSCEPADFTITVQWDDIGDDWELHLVKPGGTINDNATDCTWTSCIGVSPDWGVLGDPNDDPHKDIDNTGAFGPENIWLADPEPGTYTVMVEHWGAGSPLSDGFVTLNVAGQVVTVAITDLAPLHVWTAATITWPSAVVTTGTAIFDCSATWSSGCRAMIP